MKKLALLGSTGSIGTQTLQVVDEFPELFKIEILAANANWQLAGAQARKYKPQFVVLNDKYAYEQLTHAWNDKSVKILYGMENLLKVLGETPLDMVLGAMGGAIGIAPTLRALELGIDVALANKETIVAGGDLVRRAQARGGAKILPVDSEHSAIFQCMEHASGAFHKILLTASGGPFREFSKEELYKVKPSQALKHPNWSMGRKITIDSATLMNKGLEVIEAMHLYHMPAEKVSIVVHRESIIHSLVEYCDNAMIAQLGSADMRLPIQYALTWPRRVPGPAKELDLWNCGPLTFAHPDLDTFRCLKLALDAARTGGTAGAILNGANEAAVAQFLAGKIRFLEIADKVQRAMETVPVIQNPSLTQVLEADAAAREAAR